MEAKDYLIEIQAHGKLTQQQITDRSGIPQPTVSKILRGDVGDVMSKNYRALQALHAEVMAAPKVDEQPIRAANASPEITKG